MVRCFVKTSTIVILNLLTDWFLANSEELDQSSDCAVLLGSTLFAIPCASFGHSTDYSMAKPHCSNLSRLMTKPTKWHVHPAKTQISLGIRPVWQSLRCPHEETLGPQLPNEYPAKTLIRLGGCPGWSESSLGAQSFCWFCLEAAHFRIFMLLILSYFSSDIWTASWQNQQCDLCAQRRLRSV